jgi:protein SCO1
VTSRRCAVLVVAVLAALAAAAPARAQFWTNKHASAPPIESQPLGLEEVRIDEKLSAPVPLDTTFTDSRGRPFTLRRAFDGKKPVVLSLVYYDCPMLCGLILSGLAKTMRENGLVLGKDYEAVTISFDPEERPAQGAERRRGYLQSLGLDDLGDRWPFLVGAAQASRAVSDAVGFYVKKDERTGEWAHMAAVFVLTPDGKVSRYLYGIDYPSKEFRLSIVEAAGGRVGTSFDRFLLTCYRYDPASRKYEPYALGIMRAGSLAVLLALSGLIGGLFWRERRAKKRQTA